MNDSQRDAHSRRQPAGLWVAPDDRIAAVDPIVVTADPRRRGGGLPFALVLVVAILAAGGIAIVSGTDQNPAAPQVALPANADGQPVHTVSELLAARVAGQLKGGPIALAGYWSYPFIAHSCAAPVDRPGELEIYCHDGEFGITERDEPSAIMTDGGQLLLADGPVITPWLPESLLEALLIPPVNGRLFPPVPIVVRGHFDDPRASECREVARTICQDRFVVDELVELNKDAVAMPAVSPTPSPFPFDSPPASLFEVGQCQPPGWDLTTAFSFVGWMSGAELDLTSGRDFSAETLYVAIATEAGPLGAWYTMVGDDRESQPLGRLVCLARERDGQGIVQFDSLAGSASRIYRDGTMVKANS